MAAIDRPAWTEVVGIVIACAVLLVGLARLDNAAYEREMERARVAIAAAAREAATRPAEPHVVVQTRERAPRTESLGDRGPIAVPLGGAWSAGTTSSVADIGPVAASPEADPKLRRIVGPVAAGTPPALSEPRSSTGATAASGSGSGSDRADARRDVAPPAPKAAPAVAVPGGERHGVEPATLLVALLTGSGMLLTAAGAVLLRLGR